MQNGNTVGSLFWKELEAERVATRNCLERIAGNLFEYKPHEKSMKMGSLALIVADIPRWITHMIEKGDIDFVTYEPRSPKNAEELVALFDENMDTAKRALGNVTNADLDKPFSLKNNGQILMTTPTGDSIGSSINHMVHHRGQLTVYMRLNNIPVPSIYGPSADDKGF